ncbi:hypothetical protein SPRG_21586 [Saprolegnia parasitica CBS 223.65]|uniref:WASH complex subunit 4 N-terminal domain-containing protein n=1 Tax=Saprolegnia parasitica (strain CBS 223.65) TaxID=695850 RepID=A0A067BLD3_SAPPC|nr:hypothetical protein SPRG_21586 [Saprolegnia parasitica CBS 223.65]KDO19274.1 hypothetical protein SPRG_21586 [Saprolegnia parasitica CBS 223.65]|eukprot:XP_012210017.1 hypothetical protein SPRG_21586 [Saprolegnia parasitica CBS 223.65]
MAKKAKGDAAAEGASTPAPARQASDASSRRSDDDDHSDGAASEASHRQHDRPRFDSRVSWADSTRLDRFDSRASMMSNRDRSDSKASVRSTSSRVSTKSLRAAANNKDLPKAELDAIDEEDYQFVSAFADFDVHDQPIREQLQKSLDIVNEHTSKLKEIEDALSAAMSEVWGYWADPIQMHLHPAERVDVQDLIRTDNELFNKVLTVFAVLCDEISELKVTVEDNFYPALIMFGQAKHGDTAAVKPGEDEVHIGRMLPFFQLWKSTFKHVHLTSVFDAFANLLEILMTLDMIVLDNPNIVTSWDKYKRMMQYVRADPARYNVTLEKVKSFEQLLVNLDQTFMGAKCFQTCIEQDFETLLSFEDSEDEDEDEDAAQAKTIDVRNNRVFLDEFFHCLSTRIQSIEAALGTPAETYERTQLVGTTGLYVMFRKLMPPNVLPDAALYDKLWSCQLKAPIVVLCGRLNWCLPEFLLKYAPLQAKNAQAIDVLEARRQYLVRMDETFADDVHFVQMEVRAWLVRFESFFQWTTRGSGDTARVLGIRGNLIVKGLILARRVQTMMQTLVQLHLLLKIPMPKRIVRPLYQCIEMTKAIEFMMARKNPILAESAALVLRQVAHALTLFFRPIKARLEASKRFDDTKLDVLAAVSVVEELLHSGRRCHCIALIPDVVETGSDAKKAAAPAVNPIEALKHLWKMHVLSDFQRKIRVACDCSFLYWSRELLHLFVQDIYSMPEQASRLQYVVGGFLDAMKSLQGAQHEVETAGYVNAYATFIEGVVEEELVAPLCMDIENDLRLHIHSVHLDHMQAPTAYAHRLQGMYRWMVLHYFMDLRPLRLWGKELDLRDRVTHYLESTFYNLTTVALHDWKTYGEMRQLANDKYGLQLAENHLPMGSLDQGLDILQIMRNIHIFVARYNYNLNQQFFLERRSDKGSRHLNGISIHSIASSIRTHGMGIMNTTVNFTYQFLSKKMDIFSQFLFDDYIKSFLKRELRWYKSHKDDADVDHKYPYTRAFEFNKEIRQLGVSDAGRTFLDQYRILITEIGNALGYVRMVRSAGMNYCSNAIKFVPDLNQRNFEFAPVVQDPVLSHETVVAASNLDTALFNLSKNFSEDNNYFKVLVQVFQEAVSPDEQKHLALFYQIIPALTINFIETSVQAKDLMYKNTRRRESYFTDDGFAIGIAYFLAVLNQGEDFDALHWFEEVERKYEADEALYNAKQAERDARKQEAAAKNKKETTAELIDDEEEVHTLQLTAKRIELHRREFDLLNWSLNGARIFFKD